MAIPKLHELRISAHATASYARQSSTRPRRRCGAATPRHGAVACGTTSITLADPRDPHGTDTRPDPSREGDRICEVSSARSRVVRDCGRASRASRAARSAPLRSQQQRPRAPGGVAARVARLRVPPRRRSGVGGAVASPSCPARETAARSCFELHAASAWSRATTVSYRP